MEMSCRILLVVSIKYSCMNVEIIAMGGNNRLKIWTIKILSPHLFKILRNKVCELELIYF